MNTIKKFALILTLIGGINWLVYGIMDREIVSMVLSPPLAKLVFIIIGIAAIISLTYLTERNSGWKKFYLILSIIGGINWLLVGLMDLDLVTSIFGSHTMSAKVIYVLIGLASIVSLSLLNRNLGRSEDIAGNRRL